METMTSKMKCRSENGWLTLNEVLASVLDCDNDSDDFGHLDSESEEERRKMKECLPILASSSSAWRSWQRLAKLFLLSL